LIFLYQKREFGREIFCLRFAKIEEENEIREGVYQVDKTEAIEFRNPEVGYSI